MVEKQLLLAIIGRSDIHALNTELEENLSFIVDALTGERVKEKTVYL